MFHSLLTLVRNSRVLGEILINLDQINMKLSDLGTNMEAVKKQLVKVFGEQQTTIDSLKQKVADLESAAANADVPDNVTSLLGEIKELVQKVDDQNPDVDQPEEPQG